MCMHEKKWKFVLITRIQKISTWQLRIPVIKFDAWDGNSRHENEKFICKLNYRSLISALKKSTWGGGVGGLLLLEICAKISKFFGCSISKACIFVLHCVALFKWYSGMIFCYKYILKLIIFPRNVSFNLLWEGKGGDECSLKESFCIFYHFLFTFKRIVVRNNWLFSEIACWMDIYSIKSTSRLCCLACTWK